MWVESELAKGSRFFFTISSQISHPVMEGIISKMASFAKRTILFVDTLYDTTGVVDRIKELGLRPHVVHHVYEVADKDKCPHIDTIIVDSLAAVCPLYESTAHSHLYLQTESIREYEHLRYIPVVLLAPAMPRLNCAYARFSVRRSDLLWNSEMVLGQQHQLADNFTSVSPRSVVGSHLRSRVQYRQPSLGAKRRYL